VKRKSKENFCLREKTPVKMVWLLELILFLVFYLVIYGLLSLMSYIIFSLE